MPYQDREPASLDVYELVSLHLTTLHGRTSNNCGDFGGKFDPKLFAKTLHGATILAKDTPGVLLDGRFDDAGDLDRESSLVEVVNGKGW